MLQMRVTPAVKHGSEKVLSRLGLTMTDAVELFLRWMIIEQRLPFDVVAFDNVTYSQLISDWEQTDASSAKPNRRPSSSSRVPRRAKRD